MDKPREIFWPRTVSILLAGLLVVTMCIKLAVFAGSAESNVAVIVSVGVLVNLVLSLCFFLILYWSTTFVVWASLRLDGYVRIDRLPHKDSIEDYLQDVIEYHDFWVFHGLFHKVLYGIYSYNAGE